jgi:hypothetical protein
MAMNEAEPVYIAMRVQDQPVPQILCVKEKCSRCGMEVWVDEKARSTWSRYPILCMNCIEEIIQEEDPERIEIRLSPEIIESLKDYLAKQREMRRR